MDIKIILIILSLYSLASTITYIVYIVKYHNARKKHCIINDVGETIIANRNVSKNIRDKYKMFYNKDFYNKFDLRDNYNQQIMIYSIDLNECYIACEANDKCYGFTKYKNYCYLKSLYNDTEKNNQRGTVLALKEK